MKRCLAGLLVFRASLASAASAVARLTRLSGLSRLTGLARLIWLSRLTWLGGLAGLTRLTRLAGLPWLTLAAFAAAHTSTALGLGHVRLLSDCGRERDSQTRIAANKRFSPMRLAVGLFVLGRFTAVTAVHEPQF